MGCGIYKLTNTKNMKTYIGSSLNLSNREYKHFWMLNKGIHDNFFLQKSYNKYGKDFFLFEVVEHCEPSNIIELENFYIDKYQSNNPTKGYNLAKVNDFRRNTYNNEVKVKLSKFNLNKNGNISLYKLINVESGYSIIFDNLVDGAKYLIDNGFAKGKPTHVRQKLSSSLRGKIMNNGFNGSIRKTCYKHTFEILN